jgi:predicted TIM-barrel fold metal-dependent hydrolase
VLDAHPDRIIEVARDCNDFQAKLVSDHHDAFGAFALLPLPDIDASLKELEYALDTLSMDGVGLYSSARERFLGDPMYDPIMDELNRRQVTVFVHPAHACAPTELNLHAPDSTLEYVIDSARAILNCLWEGTFVRYPNVRWIFSHGGSGMPYLTHRLSRMAGAPRVPNVVGQLQDLYYDIASAMDRHALRSLQELADTSHILWGSDMPFISVDDLKHELEDEWEPYDGFAAARAAVEHGNAERLFPRFKA